MSCSRFQFELSQCLDGRLPSARRGVVLDHVDTCPACTKLWEEMQAAQSLVFGLAEPAVLPSFRDAVWDRIQSGEGAPEILLSEPVSILTKVRYGVIGAAAAALLLVSVNLLTTTTEVHNSSVADRGDGDAIAKQDPPTKSHSPIKDAPTRIAGNTSGNPGIVAQPLTAAALANHTVDEVKHAARRLKSRKGTILNNPGQTPAQVWVGVRDDVQTLGAGLNFLVTLEKENLLEFRGPSRSCVERARIALVHPEAKDIPNQTIRLVVKALDGCPLDGLEAGLVFTSKAVKFDERLVMVVQHAQQEWPRIGHMIRHFRVMMPQVNFRANPNQNQFLLWSTQGGDGMPTIRLRTSMPGAGDALPPATSFFEVEQLEEEQPKTKSGSRLQLRGSRSKGY